MRPYEARRARLNGWRLVFDLPVGRGGHGVANLARDAEAAVHGVAYRISDWGAAWLDRTEGVPRAYRRTAVELALEDGKTLVAFTYHSPRGRANRKPSRRSMNLILRGARHHGLPDAWVRTLRGLELAIDERDRQVEIGM
jgi:hypothetical protein